MRTLLLSAIFGILLFSNSYSHIFVTSKVETKSNDQIYEYVCEYLTGQELRYYYPEYETLNILENKVYIIIWVNYAYKNGMVIETDKDIPSDALDLSDVLIWDKYNGIHITGPMPPELMTIRPKVWKKEI